MNKFIQYILVLLIGLIGGFFGSSIKDMLFSSKTKVENVAYVRLPELQQESKLYQAFQKEIDSNFVHFQSKLDSMKIGLKELYLKAQQTDNSLIHESYNQKLEDFNVLRTRLEKEHEDLVLAKNKAYWDEVNKLLQDYGEENNMTLIFGATGNGGIMFGSDASDITSSIIEKLNSI